MKTLYFDCIAGASGDMIIGSLLDAGLKLEDLKAELDLLNLDEFEVKVRKVTKNGFSASKFDVIVTDNLSERHFSDIEKLIIGSGLKEGIKTQSLQIFKMICEAEAKIHNSHWEKVHLHELGAVDTIVDVVGALVAIDLLKIEKIISSPLPVGRGFVNGAHGKIPLPAPATASILTDVPLYGVDISKELITPTGTAILKYIVDEFTVLPPMNISSIGYGAGDRDMKIPNMIRVFIGESDEVTNVITENLYLLETNIDDQNPEFFDFVMDQLLERGALDVFFQPIQMKKNRPAIKLSVLCNPGDLFSLKKIIFKETSTIGIRQQLVTRDSLPREIIPVETEYGIVNVKAVLFEGGMPKIYPEYEDCKKLAIKNDVPIEKVYRAAVSSI